MFLIHINDLPDKNRSTCKIFADGTSFFSHALDKDTSQDELNYDLQKVKFQRKIQFNADPKKTSTRSDFFPKQRRVTTLFP